MNNKAGKRSKWKSSKDAAAAAAEERQNRAANLESDSGPPCPCMSLVSTDSVKCLLDEHAARYKLQRDVWLCSCVLCAQGAEGTPSAVSSAKKGSASKSDCCNEGATTWVKKKSKGDPTSLSAQPPPPGDFTCMSCMNTFCKRHMKDHFFDNKKKIAEKKKGKGASRLEHSVFFCFRESTAASRRFVYFCQSCDFYFENVMAMDAFDSVEDDVVDGIPVCNGRALGFELPDISERIGQMMCDAFGGRFPTKNAANGNDDDDLEGGKKRKKKRRHDGETEEDSMARKALKQKRLQIQRANGIVGITNFGNTCFYNATVQCLLRCRALVVGMTRGLTDDAIAGPITATVKALMLMSLPESFDTSIVGGMDAAARSLLKQLGKRNFMYTLGEQHDAHELLLDVLNGIGDEFDLRQSSSHVVGEGSANAAAMSGQQFQPSPTLALRNVLRCTVRCHSCLHETCTDEPTFCLGVAVPNDRNGEAAFLEHLLKGSNGSTVLTGDNAFVCGRCCGEAFRGQARRAEIDRVNRLRAVAESAAGEDLQALLNTTFVPKSAPADDSGSEDDTDGDDDEDDGLDATVQAARAAAGVEVPSGNNASAADSPPPSSQSAVTLNLPELLTAEPNVVEPVMISPVPSVSLPHQQASAAAAPEAAQEGDCRNFVDATLVRSVASLATCVVVHLQRFSPNMVTMSWDKTHRHVHFPLVIDGAALCGQEPPQPDPREEAVGVLASAFPKVPRAVIGAVLDSCCGDANTATMLLEEGVYMEPTLLAPRNQSSNAIPEAPSAPRHAQYELVGVVVHRGRSMHGGHYTSYVRAAGTGSPWLHCNDSVVDVVREDEVLNSEAYMLFYQARPQQ